MFDPSYTIHCLNMARQVLRLAPDAASTEWRLTEALVWLRRAGGAK